MGNKIAIFLIVMALVIGILVASNVPSLNALLHSSQVVQSVELSGMSPQATATVVRFQLVTF
ncbi:MAG TPA: hypothetical protein VLV31_03875 [Candidatus Acidoferrales bacterium]|nr:hypothetical protein [Candidatus Acidoferrales bacterium]